jgi:hypothetical protein
MPRSDKPTSDAEIRPKRYRLFDRDGLYLEVSIRGGKYWRLTYRALGYPKEVMTRHGFRAMARTMLDEVLNYLVDLVEHQLARVVRDANGRAYNRTAQLETRKATMQGWSDHLDQPRAQAASLPAAPLVMAAALEKAA